MISTVDPDTPAHPQDRARLPQRLQGARRGRTRHRADLRPAAHRRQRPRRPHRCRADGHRTHRAARCSPTPPTAPGETRVALQRRRHRLAIKPWPIADTGRFGRDDFTVDHDARTATCPAGHTVTLTAANNAVFEQHCHGCPLRSRCTTAHDGRILRLTRPRRRTRRSPPGLARRRLRRRLPTLATHGRTQPRLARPTRPPRRLPRHSPATASGSPTAPPPSTSNGSSTSASPTSSTGNSPPDSCAGSDNNTPPTGPTPTRVTASNPQRIGASVCPDHHPHTAALLSSLLDGVEFLPADRHVRAVAELLGCCNFRHPQGSAAQNGFGES